MDCLFCKIIKGDIPSYKIYEDELVLAFLDINPKSNGHALIIPKKHYTDYLELDNEICDHMLEVGKRIQKEIADKLKATGFTFLFNYGDAQEVKHFHLHIIPKYEDKTLTDPKDIYDLLK